MVEAIRAVRGREFTITGNGTGAELLRLDGIMREGFPGTLTSVEQALTLKPGDWLKCETTTSSIARYTLGVALLTGATAAIGDNRSTIRSEHEGAFWLPQFDLKLGEPLGPAGEPSNGVQVRAFDKGWIAVDHVRRDTTFHGGK